MSPKTPTCSVDFVAKQHWWSDPDGCREESQEEEEEEGEQNPSNCINLSSCVGESPCFFVDSVPIYAACCNFMFWLVISPSLVVRYQFPPPSVQYIESIRIPTESPPVCGCSMSFCCSCGSYRSLYKLYDLVGGLEHFLFFQILGLIIQDG